jgi:hypothetical protein
VSEIRLLRNDQHEVLRSWLKLRGRGDVVMASDACFVSMGPPHHGVWISFPVAIAWALVEEFAEQPVDVGPCRVCSGEHGGKLRRIVIEDLWAHPLDWRSLLARPRLQATANKMAREGILVRKSVGGNSYVFRTACCSNTRRRTAAAGELVLKACADPETGRSPAWRHEARQHLHVHADRLQATGHRAGAAISWAIRAYDEPTAPDPMAVAWLAELPDQVGPR